MRMSSGATERLPTKKSPQPRNVFARVRSAKLSSLECCADSTIGDARGIIPVALELVFHGIERFGNRCVFTADERVRKAILDRAVGNESIPSSHIQYLLTSMLSRGR